MRLQTLLASFLGLTLCAATPIQSEDAATGTLDKRQSTTWQDNCNPPSPAPSNYRAFNVGNCQAQLTFSRGKNVGVQWEFDAIYPDGSRVNHKPFRNFSNIAVSDTFYTLGYGNNYLTNRTQSQASTSVHELSNVCRNGVVPSAWIFYTTTEGACNPKGYRYTTGRINAVTGSRPAKTNFSARQINSAGEVEVAIPTSEYEGGNGYFTTDRGARVASSVTRAILPGITRFRNPEESRKVYVNVQGSNGVWSDTTTTFSIAVRVT